MSDKENTLIIGSAEELWQPKSRRSFLRLLGASGTVVLLPSVFAACDDDSGTNPTVSAVTLNLGNDTGILNYAYALEQLEAAYYSAVVAASIFGTLTVEQQEVMVDLRNHEVVHREFFRRVLGSNAIGNLALNQSTVNTALASTASILRTAEKFEDLGVAAYNGAGKYLTSAANLTVAGKIVSVEARHAAAIRDLREAAGITAVPARFAGDDVVLPSGPFAGLDVKLEPGAVLTAVAGTNFVTTTISVGTPLPSRTGTPDAAPPANP